MRSYAVLALAALAFALAAPLPAQPPADALRAALARQYRAELETIAREAGGVLGVQALDLASGERFGVNAELVFPQGSAIKVAVLLELYRQAEAGRLRLEERVAVRAAQQVGGAGVLQSFGDGSSELALADLAVLMIVLSDNTATNLLIERLGMENVNRTLAGLGLRETKLQRLMMRPRESARGQENLSTPAEAAALMARLARCELPLSPEGCRRMQAVLRIPKAGSFVAPLPGATRYGTRVPPALLADSVGPAAPLTRPRL